MKISSYMLCKIIADISYELKLRKVIFKLEKDFDEIRSIIPSL